MACQVSEAVGKQIVAFLVVSLSTGAEVDGGHAAALLLVGMELMVIVAVATFFSAFTTPMLAAFFTLGIYGIGHLSRDLLALGEQADQPIVTTVAAWMYRVAPDLESFNLAIEAAHLLPVTTSDVVLPLVYGAGYTTIVLVAAIALFDRRDFR